MTAKMNPTMVWAVVDRHSGVMLSMWRSRAKARAHAPFANCVARVRIVEIAAPKKRSRK